MSHPATKVMKDPEENFPVWTGIIALFILLYLFVLYKRVSEAEKAKHTDELSDNDIPDWVTTDQS